MIENDEMALRNRITDRLKEIKDFLNRYDKDMTEEFIRGFISGCEFESNIKLPSHWCWLITNDVIWGG